MPLKIMVVDDSEVIQSVVSKALKLNGYNEIILASNGQEALEIIKKEVGKIALYIFDVNMPVMDGLTLVQETRKIDPNTPIIMLTTETDKQKMIIAKNNGATGWIIKPFESDKFINIVSMYLQP
ncbi:MAG: response regulator [Spirochaetota bacterium]